MARYEMENGTVVDTKNSTRRWEEATFWNGSNHISKATGSQWDHEVLYRSKKGRYYVECYSQWQGSRDHAKWLSERDAALWLIANEHDLPNDLQKFEEEIIE